MNTGSGARAVALISILAFLTAACSGKGPTPQGEVEVSQRGPGMRPTVLDMLQLPVPRAFDLGHVEPAHFATALSKDPARIFEFVRDAIAFESYVGVLRGARGTLLAMAGNSADRALLLGTMLQASGQRVRYVRGTLPQNLARDLVSSMWAEPSGAPLAAQTPSPEVKEAGETFQTSARQNYTLILDQLKKRPATASPDVSVVMLISEARSHYWVQWWKDGGWVDLDPSFADASPGRTLTRGEQTFEVFPDSLFHQVSLRLRVEEYAGDKASSRHVLTHTARSADLGGVDVALVHMPENWKGPATSLRGGITSAIESTGRVKPVLIAGKQIVVGQVFQQKLKTTGIGAVPGLLGGEGSRTQVPLATAEWLEFETVAPDGRRETVVREIFDVVGKGRRAAGRPLSAVEIRSLTEAGQFDVAQAFYTALITSGGLHRGHLAGPTQAPQAGPPDVLRIFRQITIAAISASDGLLRRFGRPERAVVLFYADSPRLHMLELSSHAGRLRFSLDLRRAHVRGVVMGPHPEDLVRARIARGVGDGVLERVLIEHVTAELRTKGDLGSTLSTSALFDRAVAEGVPILLLPGESDRLDPGVTDDARARLREETEGGLLAVAPQRPLPIDGAPRIGWWRIDPRTGETTAVTDDGLHQTGVGYDLQINAETGQVTVTFQAYLGGVAVGPAIAVPTGLVAGSVALGQFVRWLITLEARGQIFPMP